MTKGVGENGDQKKRLTAFRKRTIIHLNGCLAGYQVRSKLRDCRLFRTRSFVGRVTWAFAMRQPCSIQLASARPWRFVNHVAFWDVLNFAMRTPATEISSLVDSSAYLRESQASREDKIVSISKFSPTQDSSLKRVLSQKWILHRFRFLCETCKGHQCRKRGKSRRQIRPLKKERLR